MAAAPTYAVRAPGWALTYRGVAVTSRIESMVLGVTYTTHAGGASPELEFEIEDRDKRWQGPWFPQRGDLVALAIGYAGETLVSCGSFQVDEVELRGPGDVIHLRCLAAFITDAMRTPNATAYENQTLLGIAGQVAKKYGFSLVGAAVNPDVTFARVSQNQETDLEFLHRLAEGANYEFNVRGTQLIFYSRTSLEQQSATSIVRRTDETRFSFKTKTHHIYKAVQVSYQNPATKQLVSATATANPAPPTGDTLKITERCENGQQAALKAAARLHRENMLQTTGELSMPGTTTITAGMKITVSGFGLFDGNYMVDKARHDLKRASGFTTDVEIRSVN